MKSTLLFTARIQNYGQDQPVYNKKAYTTSIYHGDTLKIFASHPLQPAGSEGQPEYYLTQIRSCGMTDAAATFKEWATWYRNGMDSAESIETRQPGGRMSKGIARKMKANLRPYILLRHWTSI